MMTRFVMLRLWIALFGCTMTVQFESLAEERFALVIGNDSYNANGNVAPLKNARADAKLIADTLERMGFIVRRVEDATRSEMDENLAGFEKKTDPWLYCDCLFCGTRN